MEIKPYTIPDQQSDVNYSNDNEYPLGIDSHPYYALVLKMVLWGEDRDDVYRRLEVNGVTGGIADRLYEHAREDRIRTIRSAYFIKILFGGGLFLAAVVIFPACWFGLGFIPKIVLYGCFVALGIGSWKSTDGISGYLMAPTRTGSVTDIE